MNTLRLGLTLEAMDLLLGGEEIYVVIEEVDTRVVLRMTEPPLEMKRRIERAMLEMLPTSPVKH